MSVQAERRMSLDSIHVSPKFKVRNLKNVDNYNHQEKFLSGNNNWSPTQSFALYNALKKSFQKELQSNNVGFDENYLSIIRQSTAYFRPTWIEIDLNAVCTNVRLLKEYIGEKVHLMAVVKANAYGYGILEIAQAAVFAGANWLGVATFDEALAVRSKVTQDVPILVLGYVNPQHLSVASRFHITVTGISLEWVKQAAKLAQEPFDFHLKVDTGLNRLGCKTIDDVQTAMKIVSHNRNLNCTGVFTHFATSGDMQDKSYFHRQLESFYQFLEVIPDRINKIIHCANSDAALCHPEKPFFNMVRMGKSLLGPPPEELRRLIPFQFQSTLSLHSCLVLVKEIDSGEKVGYVGEYTTTQAQWIGTVPIGYADGWHQQFKTTGVLIDGKRVPIVGRIAMDQLLVALPEYYPVGTLVTFIGRQGTDTITADEISRNAKQPEAEVLTSLSSRLPRIYMQDGSIKAIRNSLLDSLN